MNYFKPRDSADPYLYKTRVGHCVEYNTARETFRNVIYITSSWFRASPSYVEITKEEFDAIVEKRVTRKQKIISAF